MPPAGTGAKRRIQSGLAGGMPYRKAVAAGLTKAVRIQAAGGAARMDGV